MKTRPKDSGDNPNRPRRTIVGRVYEKFKPISEWSHEDDHDSLLLYLPGFRKDFIKVTIEDSSILRIRGERLLTGNKWNRFREDFEVPKTCKISGIRAKFDGGILTVTMPSKIINAPPTTAAKPQKPLKTARRNTDPANSSSSTSNVNLPPQLSMANRDGLQPPLTGVTKSYDEEKPDQKALDRAEEKEPLIETIIKTKMEMESRRNNNGIIAKLKEYYKGVVKGLAVATPAAVVAVVALGVYVYYAIGASGKRN